MNADVEIRIAERLNVVAVPTIALKIDDDIPIAAQLVGLTGEEVRASLEAQRNAVDDDSSPTSGGGYQFSNLYWVFIDRNGIPEPVSVRTGLTDLDYSEVTAGLTEGDKVLLLPSSGLIKSQQRFQEQMKQFTSLPGMSSKKEGSK